MIIINGSVLPVMKEPSYGTCEVDRSYYQKLYQETMICTPLEKKDI